MNSLKVELPLPPKLAEKPFYIPTKVFQSRFTDTLENPVMTQIRALDIRIPRHKPNDFSKVFQGRNFLQYRELRKDIQNFSLASAFRYGVELAGQAPDDKQKRLIQTRYRQLIEDFHDTFSVFSLFSDGEIILIIAEYSLFKLGSKSLSPIESHSAISRFEAFIDRMFDYDFSAPTLLSNARDRDQFDSYLALYSECDDFFRDRIEMAKVRGV